jgi:hypothetical protein
MSSTGMSSTGMTSTGILFAATGPAFRAMAVAAAESVRAHCPGLPIDLVSDGAPEGAEGLFDAVRLLPGPARYPKIPALRGTRFERTLYLDADVRVTADLTDIFEILDRFDLAAAHDQLRNSGPALAIWRQAIPNAFPQVNAGVLGYRRTPQVMAFLEAWEAGVADLGTGKDQPVLRELLWEERSLRLAILPFEYNLWDFTRIPSLNVRHTAPRVLHSHFLSQEPDLERLLGPWRTAHLAMLTRADRTLAARAGRAAEMPGRAELRRLQIARIRRGFGRAWEILRARHRPKSVELAPEAGPGRSEPPASG